MSSGSVRGWGRRLAQVAALVAVNVIGLEVISAVAVSILNRAPFTYARARAARAAALAAGGGPAQAVAGAPPLTKFATREALHPYLGFVLDRDFPRCNPSFPGYLQTLEYGFSCSVEPLFQARAAGKVLVAVLGGSVAYAFQAIGFPPLVAELQRLGHLGGARVVAIPLALPGYKQPQQLMTLTYLLSLGAQLDGVLCLDGFNEVVLPVVENVPKGTFPFFPRSWALRVGGASPAAARLTAEVALLADRRARLAATFSRFPMAYSATATVIWTLRDRALAAALAARQRDLLALPGKPADFTASGPHRSYADDAEMYADLARVWRDSSLQMHRLCTANGIRYYHFLQPNQYVGTAKPMSEAERKIAINPAQPYRLPAQRGYPYLVAAGRELRAQGVRFTDLTELFATTSEAVYVDDCCHFNSSGYALIGQAMARAIAADLEADPQARRRP